MIIINNGNTIVMYTQVGSFACSRFLKLFKAVVWTKKAGQVRKKRTVRDGRCGGEGWCMGVC